MIFPNLVLDSIIQVNDKMRLDASETFATPDEGEITNVEFSFDGGSNYIDVFNDYPEKWFLDYAFDTAGDKTIKLKITTEQNSLEVDYTTTVITENEDKLFSTDEMLYGHEVELKKLKPKGRNSYKYAHRVAQNKIIRYLDGEGITFQSGKPFAKEDLYENEYIQEFSKYQTLVLIFEDLVVRVGDVYREKVNKYTTHLVQAVKNAKLRLDFDDNDEIGEKEHKNTQMKFLGR